MKTVGEHVVEHENLAISYTVEDQSFDHEFGRHRQFGWVVDNVDLYIQEYDQWLNVTELIDKNGWLSRIVNEIVESDFSIKD